MVSLHRWAFFIPFCIVSSGAFVLSLYYPRTYSARTSFERRNDPILADLRLSQGAATFKLFRTTIARDLTSVECMSEVVDNIGLTKDFARNEDGTLMESSLRRRAGLARALGSKIRLSTGSPNEHTDIINIIYTGPDPTIGKKLLDEVKATYIRRTMVWVQQHLEGLREYYQAEATQALEELRAVQREQTRMKLDNPYLSPQDPGALSARLSQLEMERNELLRRRREYEADLEAQRQLLASIESQAVARPRQPEQEGPTPPPERLSPEAIHLLGLIEGIDAKIKELRTTRGMTDHHPEIAELLDSRRSHEAELAAQNTRARELTVANGPLTTAASPHEGRGVVSRAKQPWQGDRARLLVQIAAQSAKIKEVDISLESNRQETARLNEAKSNIFELQEEYADIAGKVEKARQHYKSLAGTLARIEPAIKANQQNKLLHWSIGQPARGGSIPVNPKARTVVLLALLAGIAAGVVFVVLAEVFDHVYRNSSQVSRSLGLPILDAIDVIITSRDRRRLLVRRTVIAPLVLLFCVGLTGITGSMAYLSIQQPHTYKRIQDIPHSAFKLLAGPARALGKPQALEPDSTS